MKKNLLLSCTLMFTCHLFSQVIFKVQAPTSLIGNMTATTNGDGMNWGLANLNDPAKAVEDTLIIVNDGSSGTNAQGHPFSAMACSAITNTIAGKIAVIYRYDGVSLNHDCGFGFKALKAQQAGAVGVVIINRGPGVLAMDGSTEGKQVTIPVSFISDQDGAKLVNQMKTEPVVVFIGSKKGKYDTDLGSLKTDIIIAPAYSMPRLLAKDGSEYSAKIGLKVRNFGKNDQNKFVVKAKVQRGDNVIYDKVSAETDVKAGDSVMINFPDFSNATYDLARYKLTYQIVPVAQDNDLSDNFFRYDFIFNDSLYSVAPLDTVTTKPFHGDNYGGVQPSNAYSTFEYCVHFKDPHASRVFVKGLYFTAGTGRQDSLSKKEVALKVYQIEEDFVNFAAMPANVTMNLLTDAFFNYPEGNQANLQGSVMYQNFPAPVILEDNKRYLFCLRTDSDAIYFGSNSDYDYTGNVKTYDQPISPIVIDDALYLRGFRGGISSLAVKMGEFHASVKENAMLDVQAYPNPTSTKMTLAIPKNGDAQITIYDLSGKLVSSSDVTVEYGKTELNLDKLEAGTYLVQVLMNSQVSKITVVKN